MSQSKSIAIRENQCRARNVFKLISMRFIRKLLEGLLPLMLLVGGAEAADVTITVNGTVVAAPCNVSTGNATVILGDIFKSSLTTPGSASTWVPVSLEINSCPIGTSLVTATFTGMVDTYGFYRNQGTAVGVSIELQDSIGTILNSGMQKQIVVDSSTQRAKFDLKVRARAMAGSSVTAGSILSMINVTYTYA